MPSDLIISAAPEEVPAAAVVSLGVSGEDGPVAAIVY